MRGRALSHLDSSPLTLNLYTSYLPHLSRVCARVMTQTAAAPTRLPRAVYVLRRHLPRQRLRVGDDLPAAPGLRDRRTGRRGAGAGRAGRRRRRRGRRVQAALGLPRRPSQAPGAAGGGRLRDGRRDPARHRDRGLRVARDRPARGGPGGKGHPHRPARHDDRGSHGVRDARPRLRPASRRGPRRGDHRAAVRGGTDLRRAQYAARLLVRRRAGNGGGGAGLDRGA